MPIDEKEERIRKLEMELDAYRHALFESTRQEMPPLTPEELEELKRGTHSLSDVIQEIENELGPANA